MCLFLPDVGDEMCLLFGVVGDEMSHIVLENLSKIPSSKPLKILI